MSPLPFAGLRYYHLDVSCRRLLFRSWHRGTQESDVILGLFAETFLTTLDGAQLGRFEALLDCADGDLFDWICGGSTPPIQCDHDVMRQRRDFWARRNRKAMAVRTTSARQPRSNMS
jgi:antitoxin CptB